MTRKLFTTLIAGALILMPMILTDRSSAAPSRSSLSLERDAQNPVAVTKDGVLAHARILWNFFFNKPADTRPTGLIPVQPLTRQQLLSAPNDKIYRFGHSTVLLKLDNGFWLTDPIFSKRASPLRFFGPQRFHPSPISIAELPPLKGVIISHDHYDHLDHAAIVQLAEKVEYFLTPLGVGEILIGWGVPAAKVRQLDWWQGLDIGAVRLIATPARHFSGRSLFGKNQTQWASWVILAPEQRLFFSGDSGYFDGFKEIGEAYGPFDLTMLETGAYDVNWPSVHMQPEEVLQAHLDLQGQRLLPIHNGTFDLAMHSWQEPFERIVTLGQNCGISVLTPLMGEAVSLHATASTRRWWAEPEDGISTAKTQPAGTPAVEPL